MAAHFSATTTAGAAASTTVVKLGDDVNDLDDVDSETELDSLISTVRHAQDKGILGQPLAVPYDASSWFVARRERLRTCRDLLALALMPSRAAAPGVAAPPRVL